MKEKLSELDIAYVRDASSELYIYYGKFLRIIETKQIEISNQDKSSTFDGITIQKGDLYNYYTFEQFYTLIDTIYLIKEIEYMSIEMKDLVLFKNYYLSQFFKPIINGLKNEIENILKDNGLIIDIVDVVYKNYYFKYQKGNYKKIKIN